jgi:hypothetical protein
MSNTTENTVDRPNAERALAGLKKNLQAAVAVQTQAAERATQVGKEVSALSQATLDAATQAAQIYARGSQDLFRQVTQSSQSAFSDALSNLRAIAAATTVKQRIELQANFVRTAALRAVADYNRFATAGIELAEQASAPLLARAVATAERFAPAA